MSTEPSREMPAEALAALQQGNKIEAIRIVREAHGIGLKEAKDYVERHIEADPVLKAAIRAHTIQISPAQMLRFALVVALIAILFLWWKNG